MVDAGACPRRVAAQRDRHLADRTEAGLALVERLSLAGR